MRPGCTRLRRSARRKRGRTRSNDAWAIPPAERIPDRTKGTSLAGAPRTRPSGRGRSFPPENSSARFARVASSDSSRPSSEQRASPSGTLVSNESGPSSTARPRNCVVRSFPPSWLGSYKVISARSPVAAASSHAADNPAIPPPITANFTIWPFRCGRGQPGGPAGRGRWPAGRHGRG